MQNFRGSRGADNRTHRPRTQAFRMAICCALALAGGLLSGLASASSQDSGAIRGFRDWQVGCDNARSCRAYGFPSNGATAGFSLRIDRGGDGVAEPRLFVSIDLDMAPRGHGEARIATEAGPLATLTIGEGLRLADGIYEIVDRSAVRAVLNAARQARWLRIQFEPRPEGADRDLPEISLDGASAALLWMDERQRRIGTETALVRPGSRPASAVPSPPPLPMKPAARPASGGSVPATLPRAALRAFAALPGGACNQDDDAREDPVIVRLAPRLLLVAIGCWRGAYNFSRAYFLLEEGQSPRISPARFPRPGDVPREQGQDAAPDNILVNAEFDPLTGTITHFAKGRGIGDCGEAGTWQWDGRAFQPVARTIMPVCRGLLDNWFEVYRTR